MSEKYLGENSTPILINQIKEKCTLKVSTLPTASADELGKIYQYIGTTSGSIVHNYFYECVSDGQDPVTYSWQNVNVQPTATPTASGTTFDNTTSELQATNVQDAIDEVEGRVDTTESDVLTLQTDVGNIQDVIPSTATSSNKLVDEASIGTAATKNYTTNVSPNNHDLVESNAVYSAINNAVSSVYTPRGNIACADLTSSLLVASNVGNVYNTTDSGTTTALFMQGAGVTIPQNSTVGIIQTSPNTYLFNLMGNTIDLHDYQKQDLTTPLTIGGTSETTVEGALGGINDLIPSDTDSTNLLVNEDGLDDEAKLRAKLGAHNFFDTKKCVLTSNSGVDFTYNDNGSITMSGTATQASQPALLCFNRNIDLNDGTYIYNIGNDTISHRVYARSNDGWTPISSGATGDVQFAVSDSYDLYMATVVLDDGSTYNTTIYPMLRLVDDVTTFHPFSRTNQQIEKDLYDTFEDDDIFIYRQGKGNLADIKLEGNTVAWNQKVLNGNFASTDGWSTNQASLSVADNIATITFSNNQGKIVQNMNSFANHVYLTTADLKANDSSSLPTLWSFFSSNSSGIRKTIDSNVSQWNNAYIIEKPSDVATSPQLQVRNISNPLPSDTTVNVRNIMCFDLTQMFGEEVANYIYSLEQANAGDGIAWFRKYFPKKYYSYNTGALQSVKVNGRKVVGKNLCSPFVIGTYINDSTGVSTASATSASTDYIRLSPNQQYIVWGLPSNLFSFVAIYDADYNFITRTSGNAQTSKLINTANYNNAHYCRVTVYENPSATGVIAEITNSKIQLEIGVVPTTYEPYRENVFNIDPIELRGVPQLVDNELDYYGDVYYSDGTVDRKFGIIDMGTMNWNKVATTGSHWEFISTTLNGLAYFPPTSGTITHGIICSKYVEKTASEVYQQATTGIAMNSSAYNQVLVADESYTDTATFKAAMSGQYLIYRLRDGVTEYATPYTNPQTSYVNGSEEFLYNDVITPIPIGVQSKYYMNKTLPSITSYVDSGDKQNVSWKSNTTLGAHNLLPIVRTSISHNGILFTANSDGSITASGTITAQGNCIGAFTLYEQFRTDLPSGRYTLTGSLPTSKGYVRASVRKDDDSVGISYDDVRGDGITFDYIQGYQMQFAIIIWGAANTVINETYYPMLRLEEDADATFKPYVMTNEELTDGLAELNEYHIRIATRVDVKDYTVTNKYTAPQDGYVMFLGSTTSETILNLNSVGLTSSTNAARNALFVKKGMTIHFEGSAATYAYYYPLGE